MPVCRSGLGVLKFVLVACLACTGSDHSAQLNDAHDDFGTPLPRDLRAERVVSLGPGTTEILVALGALDRLVGRSIWDTWPDEVLRIPELGDALRPSAERVLAARPDVVFMYASPDNKPAASLLTSAKIPVVALRVDRVDEFLAAIATIGSLMHKPVIADSLRRILRATLDSVRDARTGHGITVFLPVWNAPLMTVGSGSFLSELVAIAGGRNVYDDRSESAFVVSAEDLNQRDPDMILIGPAALSEWSPSGRWGSLRAVKQGRVVTYDTSLVGQPSLRMGRAAASLAQLFDSVGGR